ncbi:MAG: hypothetical protein MUP81_06090 [Dehalococcoidia bacterium]|nr:hypothetical protein [Dehalococcoidia bacterium]
MKEQDKDRINRLKARKGEILARMRTMRADQVTRNKEHKLSQLSDQVLAIDEKIMELEERGK